MEKTMPRYTLEIVTLVFGYSSSLMEKIDTQRNESPEELLSRLEEMIQDGEITRDEAITYLEDLRT